jgi:hypothetical protein
VFTLQNRAWFKKCQNWVTKDKAVTLRSCQEKFRGQGKFRRLA